LSGFSGINGTSGISGFSGATGASGFSGFSGFSGAATGVTLGAWSIGNSGTKMYFAFSGVNKFSLDSSGNFVAVQNVTAYGTLT
jgi:hypothetical protein